MKKILLASVYIFLLLYRTAFATHSSSEAFSRMLQLKEQGKIPGYVVERGKYKYITGNNVAHVKGKNVFMRSQPQKKSRIINKLSYTDLEYLGEWTHPNNGERWVCVRKNDEIGWIYGQYIELLEANNTKGKLIQVTSEGNKKAYKKNKNCIEDPCGALGGLLLISPILYFINWIDEQNKKNKIYNKEINVANNSEPVDIIDIISPYYKHYFQWESFGPDEEFYEAMRTAPLLDVREILQHIDFNQPDRLYWMLEIEKAAYKNPHMFVYSEVVNFLSQLGWG